MARQASEWRHHGTASGAAIMARHLGDTALIFRPLPALGTTFAASTSQTPIDWDKAALRTDDRVDALYVRWKVKLTSGSETVVRFNTDAELADLRAAVLGNIYAVAEPLKSCLDNINFDTLCALVPFNGGGVYDESLEPITQSKTLNTTGEFIYQGTLVINFARYNSATGIHFAPSGGFVHTGGITATTGDGSCSLNGVTWAVSTTSGDYNVSFALAVTPNQAAVAQPWPQYGSNALSGDYINQLQSAGYLAVVQMSDVAAELGFANNASNGVHVSGPSGDLTTLESYNPHIAVARWASGQEDGASLLRAQFTGSGDTGVAAQGDQMGLQLMRRIPLLALRANQNLDNMPVGSLRVEFGTSYATSGGGGLAYIRLVQPSGKITAGKGPCAVCPQGEPVAIAANPAVQQFVGLA